jgi:Uncharacterized protein conserved in bacteria (DUF2252)
MTCEQRPPSWARACWSSPPQVPHHAISSCLGRGTVFDDAIGRFAIAYADQTEHDYQALVDAVKRGQIVAETGI